MYVTLAKQRVMKIWYGLTGADGKGSNVFPLLAIAAVVIIPGAIYVAHRHAKFHSLEQQIQGVPQQPVGPRPGGRDPILLTRPATTGATAPEFVSATLLPGLGMSVLQLSAFLPGRGEVALLTAPTVQQMADSTFQPGVGINDMHGAVELPWSGGLEGLPSPIGMTQTEMWHGKQTTVPGDMGGRAGISEGGLLKSRDADSVGGSGLTGSAKFDGTAFDDHWFSKTETTVDVAMEATSLVLTVRAKNVGDAPEPVGIGWHPRFAILGGRRGEVMVRLPASERLEYGDRVKHDPTGRIQALDAAAAGFAGKAAELGTTSLDEGLVQMKTSGTDAGPMAEMRDPAAKYGLRVTSLSSNIREMRVYAPSDQNYVSFGPQTNYDSALSRVWSGDDGIATLLPGQTMEWKVKVEIFPVQGR